MAEDARVDPRIALGWTPFVSEDGNDPSKGTFDLCSIRGDAALKFSLFPYEKKLAVFEIVSEEFKELAPSTGVPLEPHRKKLAALCLKNLEVYMAEEEARRNDVDRAMEITSVLLPLKNATLADVAYLSCVRSNLAKECDRVESASLLGQVLVFGVFALSGRSWLGVVCGLIVWSVVNGFVLESLRVSERLLYVVELIELKLLAPDVAVFTPSNGLKSKIRRLMSHVDLMGISLAIVSENAHRMTEFSSDEVYSLSDEAFTFRFVLAAHLVLLSFESVLGTSQIPSLLYKFYLTFCLFRCGSTWPTKTWVLMLMASMFPTLTVGAFGGALLGVILVETILENRVKDFTASNFGFSVAELSERYPKSVLLCTCLIAFIGYATIYALAFSHADFATNNSFWVGVGFWTLTLVSIRPDLVLSLVRKFNSTTTQAPPDDKSRSDPDVAASDRKKNMRSQFANMYQQEAD